MSGEEVAQVFVVLPQVFFQFVQPFAAFVVGCDQGFDRKGVQCVEFVIDELPVDFPAYLGIAAMMLAACRPAMLKVLLGAVTGMPQKLFVQRGERNVAMAVERQVAVDFVRYDRYPVPAAADLPEACQLFGGPGPARRVVGVAQEDQFYLRVRRLVRSRSSKSMR